MLPRHFVAAGWTFSMLGAALVGEPPKPVAVYTVMLGLWLLGIGIGWRMAEDG